MLLKRFNQFIIESAESTDLGRKMENLLVEITRLVNIALNKEDSAQTLTARWSPGDWQDHQASMRTEVGLDWQTAGTTGQRHRVDLSFVYYLVSKDGAFTGAASGYGVLELNLAADQYYASDFPTLDSYSLSVFWAMDAPWNSKYETEMFSASGETDDTLIEFSAKQKYEDSFAEIIANHLIADFTEVNASFQDELDNLDPVEDPFADEDDEDEDWDSDDN
jgi:hypothetical protein